MIHIDLTDALRYSQILPEEGAVEALWGEASRESRNGS